MLGYITETASISDFFTCIYDSYTSTTARPISKEDYRYARWCVTSDESREDDLAKKLYAYEKKSNRKLEMLFIRFEEILDTVKDKSWSHG